MLEKKLNGENTQWLRDSRLEYIIKELSSLLFFFVKLSLLSCFILVHILNLYCSHVPELNNCYAHTFSI